MYKLLGQDLQLEIGILLMITSDKVKGKRGITPVMQGEAVPLT